MDKLDAMQTFVKIVDERSLTKAAKALHKSQPTVVRSLSLLEEQLGVRLLQRTTRKMSLTPEGQTYLVRCRQILGDVAEAEAALQRESTELSGALRVTAPALFGNLHVAPAIFEFLQEHSQVRIELILLDRVVDLVEEGFDLGVRIAQLEDSSLVSTKVTEVVRTCVASPALLRAVGEPKHPEELRELPAVTFAHETLESWKFTIDGNTQKLTPTSAFSTNQSQTAIRACVSGLCFGQFLSYQVEQELADGRLVRVLPTFEPGPTPVHLIFAHRRLLTARQRALLDWLKQRLSGVGKLR